MKDYQGVPNLVFRGGPLLWEKGSSPENRVWNPVVIFHGMGRLLVFHGPPTAPLPPPRWSFLFAKAAPKKRRRQTARQTMIFLHWEVKPLKTGAAKAGAHHTTKIITQPFTNPCIWFAAEHVPSL